MYVDDLLLISSDKDQLNETQKKLSETYAVKCFDAHAFKFLDIAIKQTENSIIMSQKPLIQKILADFGMLDCKKQPLPMEPQLKLDLNENKEPDERTFTLQTATR